MEKWIEKLQQPHLFKDWDKYPEDDPRKQDFLNQLERLDSSYPGGLRAYIDRARELLRQSQRGDNPYEGWTPSVPTGEEIEYKDFNSIEEIGMQQIPKCAFVLVAGGLGERLGYSGIKIQLPVDTISNRCYLQVYISRILALQRSSNASVELPLVIMVSSDTEGPTNELLAKNNRFGMSEDQITIIRQEKVACFSDNNGSLALDPDDPFKLLTKPHGHGDIHMLLHQHGIASKWTASGREWVIFFQDTNVMVCNAFVALLGMSKKNQYDVNSAAIRRKAKDASGGIVRLTHQDGRRCLTLNVEYNQLDPLLRNTINPDGDVNGDDGYSCFPGNINLIAIRLPSYVETLKRTGGVLNEFINPKYADPITRTSFKKPARLECMMQDYPKALSATDRVGFTIFQSWLVYSPCKNNIIDAAQKVAQGIPAQSASTAEHDYYAANARMLESIGINLSTTAQPDRIFQSIPVYNGPKVIWNDGFAPTRAILQSRFPFPSNVKLSSNSTLFIDGSDIEFNALDLDGALRLCGKAIVQSLQVKNNGVLLKEIEKNDTADEIVAIRGYKTCCKEIEIIQY